MSSPALAFPDLTYEAEWLPPDKPVPIGSEAHKTLFCRTLLDTFDPYRPAIIDWPKLDAETQDRLMRLPIWDMAVQTENRAGLNVSSYAEDVSDPLLNKAVNLNAFEEKRHRYVLSNLVEAYGIKLAPEPVYPKPRDHEWAFMVTGYSECIDSFFAFGLFEIARRSGFFPPALVTTFETVMAEEGRHILFFVNWAAWHRQNLPWSRRVLFDLKRLRVWAFLVWERLGMARDMGGATNDSNFTLSGAKEMGIEISISSLMDVCLKENDRRLSSYDSRLLRPETVPWIVRFVRRFIPG
jgi:hypothetical protein